MYKTFSSDKDTYITNRIISESRMYESNVGLAGTIDLFKIYGYSLSGSVYTNTELSRGLLHFDLSSLIDLYDDSKIDPTHSSFFAKLVLYDVYGGQPTPKNYTLAVCALSKSFDEGHGKDVVYYSDSDSANYITSSYGQAWSSQGCELSSSVVTDQCDYYNGSYRTTQYFSTGEEDLNIDVTTFVSGVITRTIPNSGLRVSFSDAEEANLRTYFVKRFGSRQAYDESKRPKLIVGFDDSYRDTSTDMTYDESARLVFYNYRNSELSNLYTVSGSVTGSNSLILKMNLPISGGTYNFIFTGSQLYHGVNSVTGIYYADVFLSASNQYIITEQLTSGSSLEFTPIWGSLDGSTSFKTGSIIVVNEADRGSNFRSPKNLAVTVYGINSVHKQDEVVTARVNIFDTESPTISLVKTPKNSSGVLRGIASDSFYSVRDVTSQEVVIPFDTTNGSTRLSSDSTNMFFSLDMSNFIVDRTYVVDIMLKTAGVYQTYRNVSPIFKVSNIHFN